MICENSATFLARCPVCNSADRADVLSLPGFPLTGLYVVDPAETVPAPDQALMLCGACGHGYLAHVVDPAVLYAKSYAHRTGGSALARGGNDFFWTFLENLTSGRRFRSVLEVGANDLYLMEKLRTIADAAVALDPIWRDETSPATWPNVSVQGKFIAELDVVRDLPGPPDLVVAAHTFEHIVDPCHQLQILVDAAAADALFVIEIPSFDTLLANLRFDQVFHQHVQYFSLASALRMVERLGCAYVAHTVNYCLWGGTLLFAFRKAVEHRGASPAASRVEAAQVVARVARFKRQCVGLREEIAEYGGVVYGFGAAQMLPTLAYHMDSDMAFLKAFIDDNRDRVGKFFPGWKTPILSPDACADIRDAGVVVTALDSCRPILRRLLTMEPRVIFNPIFKF